MHQYTDRNHFRFGYDGKWFTQRSSGEQKWTVAYGPCTRPVKDWRTENTDAARLIWERHKDPCLLFSGGLDSEIALRAFIDAGVPVKVYTIRFENGLNWHDTKYAGDACEALGVRQHFLDLNLGDYAASGEADHYGNIAHAPAPEVTISMWAADRMDGTPVVGQGECYLAKDLPSTFIPKISREVPAPWVLMEREWVASWYRFFLHSHRPAVPGFFQYTAEQILSFLNEPLVQQMTRDEIPGVIESPTIKHRIYSHRYPVEARQKYTGFELAGNALRFARSRLALRYADYNGEAKTPVTTLIQNLLPL
jgi:hypothetical protein